MRKLFLASSFRTLDQNLKNELLKFLPKKPEEILVGHIPNAGDVKEDRSYIDITKDQLRSMGMNVKDVDLRDQNTETLKKELADCDVILVNGGNTYYLLNLVRKSGFDKVINEFLDQGKVYIGISAGSYIACPTIEQSGWKRVDEDAEKSKLDDLTALSLVPFIISAHYNREKYREAVADGVAKTKYPVVALYDTQAIEVIDDKYKVVGDGPKEFFNGFKENWDAK